MRKLLVVAAMLALALPADQQNATGQDTSKGSTAASLPPPEPHPFDTFGKLPCGYELARLDPLADALQSDPKVTAYIVMYGPRRPRPYEVRSRLLRMKAYLVNRRKIAPSRVIAVDGGREEEVRGFFWLSPPGTLPPIDEAILRRGRVFLPKRRRVTDCEDSYNRHH